MPQLNYRRNMRPGFPGMLYTGGIKETLTALNDDPRAQQVVSFVVTALATSGTLTIQNIEFSVADQADVAAVADALAAAVNAEPLVNGLVIAESDGVDTVTVTARLGGVGFTFADDGGTTTTATEDQANAEAAPINFGRAVVESGEARDGERLCKLIDTSTVSSILGIAHYSAQQEKPRPTGLFDETEAFYPGGSAVNILRSGMIYVETEGDVAVGDPVYVRHAADGALDQLGIFAGASGTGLAQISNARWKQGTRDGVAVLQVNFD